MLKPNRSKFYLQSNRKNEWATVEEEQQARQAALEEQLKTLQAVLPDILKKFDRIPDPRRPRSTRHKLKVIRLRVAMSRDKPPYEELCSVFYLPGLSIHILSGLPTNNFVSCCPIG